MRKVRFGMVGGGPGSFIGEVHRCIAKIDGELELVCGAFSRDGEKSKSTGKKLGLAPSRVYKNYEQIQSKTRKFILEFLFI